MTYRIIACGDTDVGKVRQNNEDDWKAVPELNFYVLADGMGGHKAGEVASSMTVEEICKLVALDLNNKEKKTPEEIVAILQNAIQLVNEKIFQMSLSEENLRGMGTTLCCTYFDQQRAFCAHVGDSRIYRLRQGKLSLITSDHSLLQELVDLGQLNDEEASDFVYRNIITKAIGTEPFVDATITINELESGDIYMMCTDGLSDLLDVAEMEAVINKNSSVKEMVAELIDSANGKGGVDNITTVVMQVK